MLKVGQVVLVDGEVYMTESPLTLGGALRLVPIKLDAERQTRTMSEINDLVLDYCTRKPVQ